MKPKPDKPEKCKKHGKLDCPVCAARLAKVGVPRIEVVL